MYSTRVGALILHTIVGAVVPTEALLYRGAPYVGFRVGYSVRVDKQNSTPHFCSKVRPKATKAPLAQIMVHRSGLPAVLLANLWNHLRNRPLMMSKGGAEAENGESQAGTVGVKVPVWQYLYEETAQSTIKPTGLTNSSGHRMFKKQAALRL